MGGFTGREQLVLAEEAAAARDHERDHHPVTGAYGCHCATNVFDDPHELVAEDIARLDQRDLATIQVQVRAADGRGGHPQKDIVIFLQVRFWHVVDTDIASAVIGQCAHA
ncbi:hypothetical protein D3C79_871520 [compost metagenome]